jgi:hypothetical protein
MIDIENPGGIAGLGRGEDTMLAHVAPGEMVVPPVLSPETQETIKQEMIAVGLDPNQYTVGDGMSINPITGMAEFGFLKKLGKSLKKVVKKVAPIALPLLIPGVGSAITGALGAGAGAAGAATGIFGGTIGPTIKAGLGSFFNPATGAKGIFGGSIGPSIRRGIGGLGSSLFGGGQQDVMYQDQFGNVVSAEEFASMSDADKPMYSQVRNPNIFRRVLGSTKGQSGIGVIEDIIKGKESDFTKERGEEAGGVRGMLPDNAGLMALAALYGKAVKEDFKDKEGGLKDIRQSIRPDLMPAPTFTGFDLGIRPTMSYGGRIDEQELDLRMGGPSIGPGTGTSDDIPAMLSDGEFVMTSSANNGLGGFKITKTETGIELIPNGAPDRQKGAKNMDKLMKTFEKFNEIGKV